MTKILFLIIAFCILATGISAQNLAGQYAKIYGEGPQSRFQSLVLKFENKTYIGSFSDAHVTGRDEVKHPLTNLVVNEEDKTISFIMNNELHTGMFVSPCQNGLYTLRFQSDRNNYTLPNRKCN